MTEFELIFKVCVQILAAAVGSLGFGVLFNLRGKKLLATAFGGALAWGAFLLFSFFGMTLPLAPGQI